MIIRKRNGTEVIFDKDKIIKAVTGANNSISDGKITKKQINNIANYITKTVIKSMIVPTVEDIQNMVEKELIKRNKYELAKAYITYRYLHSINKPQGANNSITESAKTMLQGINRDIFTENSNKSPILSNVARDYLAGLVCKELSKEIVPSDLMNSHNEGIIHIHDLDISPAMAEHNCELMDIDDALQNGTMMGGTFIHKPNSLMTAATIVTQISISVCGVSYGGQTLAIDHLVPFVNISRQKIRKQVEYEWRDIQDKDWAKPRIEEIVKDRLAKEISSAVQTIQYQEITCACSNGQSPFITVWLSLGTPDYGAMAKHCHTEEERNLFRYDAALLIEEILKQRIKGVQAPDGSWVAPVFPKLIYELTELNINPDSEFYYLTELARDCTIKRMVPDYVSEKVMKQLRGYSFSSMGCLDYKERIDLENSFNKPIGRVTEVIEELYNNKEPILNFINSNLSDLELFESPYIKLHKTGDGKIQVITSAKSKYNAVMFDDVSFIFDTMKEETSKTVLYRIPKDTLKIWSGNETTELNTVLYNKDVTNWLRIGYKYDSIHNRIRYLTLTSDHPLIEYETNKEIKADELVIGSKLRRVNKNAFQQLSYVEIVSIEKLDRCSKSYDVSTGNEHFNINGEIYSHNCRSQLNIVVPKDKPECILEYGTKENGHENEVMTVDKKWRNPNEPIFYGRFNMGVCTVNLPDVSLTVLEKNLKDKSQIGKKDFTSNETIMSKFWELFNERLELCHRVLRVRYERLKGTSSNIAPILWQGGVLARLNKDETIDKLLINGWATISLGYAGLYETVKSLTGQSHTSESGRQIGLKIMSKMKEACDSWKNSEPEHLGYSLYATPLENTTTKFARALQRRHGMIEGITDRLYVTNSYHVPVFEKIDAFSKLSIEAPFQDISSGGNISYIELPSMCRNKEALMSVIKHIYNTNIYAEINTKLDHCYECGYMGEINLLSTDRGRFKLKCPNCGNEDSRKMYVIRRLCGYIGRIDAKDNPMSSDPSSSDGRLGDIHDRVCHL